MATPANTFPNPNGNYATMFGSQKADLMQQGLPEANAVGVLLKTYGGGGDTGDGSSVPEINEVAADDLGN